MASKKSVNSKDLLLKRIEKLEEQLVIEKVRINRVVQVLINTLPEQQLNSKVVFHGLDCHNRPRNWDGSYDWFDGTRVPSPWTLKDFLREIIDP